MFFKLFFLARCISLYSMDTCLTTFVDVVMFKRVKSCRVSSCRVVRLCVIVKLLAMLTFCERGGGVGQLLSKARDGVCLDGGGGWGRMFV